MHLDKAKIRQSFSVAALTYDDMAVLQRSVGVDLLSRFDFQTQIDTTLDLGCGTGFLTGELLTLLNCNQIVALDIALPMLQLMKQKKPDKNIHYLCADVEKMPVIHAAVDQVFSNLALQWCPNLEPVLTQMGAILKTGGALIFSIFGPATLAELKAAWATVDDYSHVNDFVDGVEIAHFLRQAGFDQIEIESVYYQLNYPDVMALMRQLKGLGAHNVILSRNKNMTTRRQLQQMVSAYEKQCVDGIMASYEVIFVKAIAL